MLRARARGALLVVGVVVAVLAAGQPVIGLGLAILAALAASETVVLLRRAGWPSSSWLAVFVGAAVVLILGLGEWLPEPLLPPLAPLLLLTVGVALAAVDAFTRADPREGLATWMGTLFAALYVVPLGFAGALVGLGPELPRGALLVGLGADRAWFALLVVTVWAYDSGAYLVGRRFGRRRFLTHLSPSKTEAGLLGGLLAATLVSGLVLGGLGLPTSWAILFGPLVGLAAQVGDLAESMLKRAAGVKDSSSLIPGHGGVLDRIDSFVVAAPVAAFVLTLLSR